MDQTGIRGIAGQTLMDEGGCDASDADQSLSMAKELIETYRMHPRISGCAAPHATNTCSPQILKKAWELDTANQVPFTLHAAEMDYEMTWLAQTRGCTPVGYLDQLGVLSDQTAAAHCIHLTDRDIEILRQRGSGVCHCIGSNAKAAKGVAPVLKLLKEGVSVGLGTDGPASGNTLDLFTQMRLCAGFQKTIAMTEVPCLQKILFPWRPVREPGFWDWKKKQVLLNLAKKQTWYWWKQILPICFLFTIPILPWFTVPMHPM